MQCPICNKEFDIRVKGEVTNIAHFECTNCGYSRTAKENIILRLILEDHAEALGIDPSTVKENPLTPKELKVCLSSLIKQSDPQ
jgi:Zn ribbon nucleic-acid-binding protein